MFWIASPKKSQSFLSLLHWKEDKTSKKLQVSENNSAVLHMEVWEELLGVR